MPVSSRTRAPLSPPPALIIAVLCFGSLAGALMQSLVIPIQSELPELLGTNASNTSWVVTVTLLAGGIAMPVSGRLADMYGKKRVIVISAAILLVGSVVTAASSTLGPVLVGRALQGVAMGYIPVAISLVREIAPAHLRAGAVMAALLTSQTRVLTPGVPPIPPETAFQLCFAVGALATLAGAGITLLVPRDRPRRTIGHADAPGTAALAEESVAG